VASIASAAGRDVRVEILQPKDIGIVAGRCRDAIDVEARDVLQTLHAHQTLLRSVSASLMGTRRHVLLVLAGESLVR